MEVRDWSIEAKEEDPSYFFHFNDVNLIENGKKSFVIGRKGAGKTAIAEFLHNKKDYNKFTRKLSFKNFPFNILYKHSDTNYRRPNQYISIWKYVIMHCICSMLAENEAIYSKMPKDLRKAFKYDIESALSATVHSITSKEYAVSFLGVDLTSGSVASTDEFIIHRANETLQQFINEYVDDSSYFVLFDELDEDYKGVLDPDRREEYFELIVSLFKAVQDIRAQFKKFPNIVPVVFLRNDIFDLCRDPDKNKWLDRAVFLNWGFHDLHRLAAFRLAVASGMHGGGVDESNVWRNLFVNEEIRFGHRGRRKKETFKYIYDRTFSRPRDVVSYLRECARICHDDNFLNFNNTIVVCPLESGPP